ncbi:MAG TPA: hypothetical protein VKA83_09255 [Methylomirabilota bacterium]|nr:hypothetical protein [Methylomirabilota bacterium]
MSQAQTIAEAAAKMTLDDAVRVARSIQRDLETGKLHVPYPPQVRRSLFVCITVFDREGVASKDAKAIVDRLAAVTDPTDVVVPAW